MDQSSYIQKSAIIVLVLNKTLAKNIIKHILINQLQNCVLKELSIVLTLQYAGSQEVILIPLTVILVLIKNLSLFFFNFK